MEQRYSTAATAIRSSGIQRILIKDASSQVMPQSNADAFPAHLQTKIYTTEDRPRLRSANRFYRIPRPVRRHRTGQNHRQGVRHRSPARRSGYA